MNNLNLNDIKPLVNVDDYSFYLFLFLVVIGFLFLFAIIYLLFFRKTKKINQKKNSIKILNELDYNNPKECAYIITKELRAICINEREKNLANEIILLLEDYKYKKDVPLINDEIKSKLEILMDIIDG